MESAFRRRALISGAAAGALALAGLFVMRSSGLSLLHGVPLAFVIVSGVAGLATFGLCWAWRFALARLTAALAVVAVVAGWAAAQTPRLLPGLTVTQAAAGRSVLVALLVAICVGLVVLAPSLLLLFTLYLRGRLDTPEHEHTEGPPLSSAATAARTRAAHAAGARGPGRGLVLGRVRGWSAAAVIGLIGGTALVVFTDATWEHLFGVALLVLCAVSVFTLAAPE
jgi:cytochrome d ubiquinol oxidase subunit II